MSIVWLLVDWQVARNPCPSELLGPAQLLTSSLPERLSGNPLMYPARKRHVTLDPRFADVALRLFSSGQML